MARLDIRTFIRAPQTRVWDVIADLPGQARWMVDVRHLEIVSETRSGAGTVIETTSDLFGLPLVRDVMEITNWEPPHRFDVRHRGQFHGTGAFILEPAAGGTVFVWLEEFRPPLGPAGELGWRLVVAPHVRRVFARSMDNVRRMAEEGAAAEMPRTPPSAREEAGRRH